MTIINGCDNFAYDEQDMGLFTLKMNMDIDNSYPYDSTCPSSSGSFSTSPSQYDPNTPNSRTSTPQQYTSFDGSFDSSAIFTPPPSASLEGFPQDCYNKQTVAPPMLTQHGLPSTPTRCNVFDSNIFDSTLSSHHGLDYNSLGNMDSCDLFFDPSPLSHFCNTPPTTTTSFEALCQYTNTDPITFPSPSMHLYNSDSSPCISPSYGQNRRRLAMDGPQQSSTMLQMQTMSLMPDVDFMTEDIEQQQAHLGSTFGVPHTPSKIRSSKARATAGRSAARSAASSRITKSAQGVRKARSKGEETSSRRFFCDRPDCDKSFRRLEHLKRHENGHKEVFYVCEFCPKGGKNFQLARKDNFIDHLRRHCNNDTGSRTPYRPEAHAVYAKYESEKKPKNTKNKKTQKSGGGHSGASGVRRRAGKTHQVMKTESNMSDNES